MEALEEIGKFHFRDGVQLALGAQELDQLCHGKQFDADRFDLDVLGGDFILPDSLRIDQADGLRWQGLRRR